MVHSERSIQRALALHFDYATQLVCVPNTSLFDWEMDFLVISKAGVISEVEIKISLADWHNDLQKDKWKSKRIHDIGRFWYAVPHFLANKIPDWVPEYVGILSIATDDTGKHNRVHAVVREAKLRSKYRASARDLHHCFRGVHLRYWDHRTGIH